MIGMSCRFMMDNHMVYMKTTSVLKHRGRFCDLQVKILDWNLLSDTELFLGDDGTVAVDVFADKIIQQATTLTYQCLKGTCGRIIFMI